MKWTDLTKEFGTVVVDIAGDLRLNKEIREGSLDKIEDILFRIKEMSTYDHMIHSDIAFYMIYLFGQSLTEAEYAREKKDEIEKFAWELFSKYALLFNPK